MVDFNKLLEEHRAKGKRLGYCYHNNCKWPNAVYEIDILPAYANAPDNEKKAKCPHCKCYVLVANLTRSDRATLAVKNKQKIQFRYDRSDRKFHLYIPEYDEITVTRKNAIKLAKWILSYEN